MGVEPTRPAWKAGILPLNYTRISATVLFYHKWYQKSTPKLKKSSLSLKQAHALKHNLLLYIIFCFCCKMRQSFFVSILQDTRQE